MIPRSAWALTALMALSPFTAGQDLRWTKQAPVPTDGQIRDVCVLSNDELWIAATPTLGDQGEWIHTTDGGSTWTTAAATRTQWAVYFTDPQYGWAAGNAFHHTTDGGKTWVKDNDWGSIYDLYFLDRQHGWACGNGGVAYWTDDGGRNWNAVSTGAGHTLRSIFFVDAQLGFTVSIGGDIRKSTDGGRSWTKLYTASTQLTSVQFFDSLEGWAVGGTSFLHTTDGGSTWQQASIPSNTWAHAARFASDRLHGIAVGESGNVVVTEDGGTSWQRIRAIGTGQRLWTVDFSDPLHAVLGGELGVIEATDDGGKSWRSLQDGAAGIVHAVRALDASTAWAANDFGEVARTTDGGLHWARSLVTGFDVYGKILDVDFADRDTGWAVGVHNDFSGSYGRVAHSKDGGRTWALQLDGFGSEPQGVVAVDAQTAYVFFRLPFAGGAVLKTTNGGRTWNDVSPESSGFRGGFFLDRSVGWAVGSRIWKTTDGGATWRKQHDAAAQIAALSFCDADHGWAVGFANQLLYTDNGGATWVPQTSGASSKVALLGVAAISPRSAWISGWDGFVAQTDDGGQTWSTQDVHQNCDFEAAAFFDGGTGWVGGNFGIWRADPVGGWFDLGQGLPGSAGMPIAVAQGRPTAGATVSLELSHLLPKVPAFLIFGFARADLPFFGGTLVPAPDFVFKRLRSDANGELLLQGTWPGGLPVGTSIYLQSWNADPGAVQGLSATNALQAIAE